MLFQLSFPRFNMRRVWFKWCHRKNHTARNMRYSLCHRDWLRSSMAKMIVSISLFSFLSFSLCLCMAVVRSVVLPMFGLYLGADVTLYAVNLHCHVMMRSCYVAIIFQTRQSNLLHLARVYNIAAHREPQIRSSITQWAILHAVMCIGATCAVSHITK